LINSVGARSQDAASALVFAEWAVDDLHYLADADERFFTGAVGETPHILAASSTSRTPAGQPAAP
jgi:hypothetical protein